MCRPLSRYCYGGKVAILLAGEEAPVVDAISVAHPSALEVGGDTMAELGLRMGQGGGGRSIRNIGSLGFVKSGELERE